MPRLSPCDYEAALLLLREAGDVEGTIAFPKPVLEVLRRLIPCDVVTYHEDVGGEAGLVSAGEARGSMPTDYRVSCKRHWHQDRLAPATGARKVSDFLSQRQFHRTELYQYAAGPVGIEDMFRLWLDPGSGSGARLEFDRGRRDFSERDRDVLDVLSPHLAQLRKRAVARQRASLPLTAAAETLTEREREILALVAAGMTTGTIAAELWISQGTVRKHLDNVFRKLGVHTRAAAVAAIAATAMFAGGEPRSAPCDYVRGS
jgi:DNA-binding CsgD family transcriptional regulator